ncbi:hypothetical protein BJ165DRAFT_1075409 [Panaeolus papilionaceus]|nr:hypothetical protein BJ165DRAFT_1075409 [Panaeolus papilionaceus]
MPSQKVFILQHHPSTCLALPSSNLPLLEHLHPSTMIQAHLNTLSWRPPVFPLEIFDLIVKSLVDASDRLYPSPCASDILSALRACAVACKSFRALCLPHLFREVEIGPTNPSARRRLAELIVTTPEISKYIRRLSYHRTTPFIFPGDTDIANLLPVLRLLNVDTLSIRTVQSNYETRIRYYDDNGFRKFFDYFTSTSKLTTLHLHGVLGAPIFQILTAPRLKTLSVDSVMFSQWGPFFPHGRTDTSTSPRIRMTKFSMHETEFELAALSYFTDLEEVSFGYGWPAYLNFDSCQDNALYFPKFKTGRDNCVSKREWCGHQSRDPQRQ